MELTGRFGIPTGHVCQATVLLSAAIDKQDFHLARYNEIFILQYYQDAQIWVL